MTWSTINLAYLITNSRILLRYFRQGAHNSLSLPINGVNCSNVLKWFDGAFPDNECALGGVLPRPTNIFHCVALNGYTDLGDWFPIIVCQFDYN